MEGDGGEDYYQAQYMWSKKMKYHKDHFLYRSLSEAVNPEFLTPGDDKATTLDELKGTYGAATAMAADAAGTGDTVAMKGGRVVGDGSWGGYDPSSASDLECGIEAAPTAPALADPGPSAPPVVPAAPSAPTPHPPSGAAEADAPSAPKPHRPAAAETAGRVVWEYEGNHGFIPFNDDCQDFIEQKYNEFLSGGKCKGKGKGKSKGQAQINVRTCGKRVSVDFELMTSKVHDSHKIRSIRRQG